MAVKKVRSRKTIAEASRRTRRMAPSNQHSGGVAERLNAAAWKAVGRLTASRGFESHPLRRAGAARPAAGNGARRPNRRNIDPSGIRAPGGERWLRRAE